MTTARKIMPRTKRATLVGMASCPLARGFGVDAVAEPLLQRLQLFFDGAFCFEPGELIGDSLLAPEIEDLDLAFHLVERVLDLLETGKRIGDALVIKMRTQLDAVGRSLLPRDDRLLAHLGVGKLGLQLGDVLVLLGERILDLLTLMLECRQRLADAGLREQRG